AALAKAWLGARDEAQLRTAELQKAAPQAIATALASSQANVAAGKTDDALATLGEAATRTPPALLAPAIKALVEKSSGKLDAARADAETLLAQALAPDARWLPAGEDELVLVAFQRRLGLGGPESSARAIRVEVLIQSQRMDEAKRELE